jgi:hypothetical protein
MMATRKILSALTVLMMLTSGVTLTALGEDTLPMALSEGASSLEEDVFYLSEPSISAEEEAALDTYRTPFGDEIAMVGDHTTPGIRPSLDAKESMDLQWDPSLDIMDRLASAPEGSDSLPGESEHRAPPKILLVDDDNSDDTNSTAAYDNSGPYSMDVGKVYADTLIANGYVKGSDFDVHVVDNGTDGPVFDKLSDYSTIIWAYGYEWGWAPTMTLMDFWRLVSFMESGGSVWFNGPAFISSIYGNVNYTIGGTNDFDPDDFPRKYLGIRETYHHTGHPGSMNTSASAIMTGSENYPTRDFFNQFGDQTDILGAILRPVSTGTTILHGDVDTIFGVSYDDEPFAIAYDSGDWRVVTSSVSLASIASAADREDYMDKVMTWLGTPALDAGRENIMNINITVEDQAPRQTADFNFAYWGLLYQDPQTGQLFRLYNPITATVHTHEDFTYTSNFENHGPAKTNMPVRFLIYDAMGAEMGNFTRNVNVGAKQLGSITSTFRPTRAGFYQIFTNITIPNDAYRFDNRLDSRFWGRIRVPKWLDDLENGTTSWTKEGAWKESNNADHYLTANTGWYWSKTGTTDADGDSLLSPVVDLRFYNLSFTHPIFQNDKIIMMKFLFKGRFPTGTSNDYCELLMKASNMTTWRSLMKIDGNTPGANNVPGDFEEGWWSIPSGWYMGDYWGQTVQFKWTFVKNRATSTSWWAMDQFITWMHHERNEAPWFTEKVPAEQDFDVDVGTTLDLRVLAEDPTMDEPIIYKWLENGDPIVGADTNSTSIVIPRTVASGDKYERGNTLNIVVAAKDDLAWNDTYWNINLLDPRPIAADGFRDLITINEDEETDVDFGTSQNVKWFEDIEGQDFTVTSTGSAQIRVTEKGNNVLSIVNDLPDWNGWSNITLRVTDSADSYRDFPVEIRVLPVNDAPQWVPVNLPDGEQDSFYSFNLTATDGDNDFGELTFSDDFEFFDISASGEIAFVPRNEHVGDNFFNVTVEDPSGLTDTMALKLFVVNVNDPPILTYIEPQSAYEDELFILNVSDYVSDPDLLLPIAYRDRITYRDDTPKLDTNLETGVVTWDTPSNDDVGDFYFKITIQDSKGRYAEQEVRIEVFNTNDPPEIGTISRQVLHQDSLYTFNIPYEDEDLDVPGVDEELSFSNTNRDLFIIDAATGRIQFTPENNQVGVWEVDITVTDAEGETATKQVIFEVLNENDAPSIEYIRVQDLVEDVPFELQVLADDPDMEERLVDGLAVDPDEELTYRTNSTRVPIDPETGLISFTPSNDDALRGSIMVKITVVDASSETNTVDVLFQVEGVNDNPEDLQIIGLLEGQKVKTDKKYQLMANAKDVDNTPEELTYMWYAGTTLIGQTQTLQWKPKGKGLTEVRLVVSDPEGGETTFSMNVTVQKVGDSPGFTTAFGILAVAFVGMMAAVARRRRLA